ncbi:MAG: protein phosphatase 2C domain-containing protein [Burkholderiaceae bacterium]
MTPPPVHALLNTDCSEPVSFRCRLGETILFAQPRPGKPINEDCVAVIDLSENQCVLALADGVGGSPAGAEASRLAIESVLSSLSDSSDNGSSRSSILDAFELAHKSVSGLGNGAACTLIIAEIFDRMLRTYHAGDSGCLVVGQRGKTKLRTVFHSPIGYAEEAGFIDEHEAIRHEDRHIISNAIGLEGMSVEVGSPMQLDLRDTVIIASDGVFDNAVVDEIGADIRIGKLPTAARRLLSRTNRRMSDEYAGEVSKPDDLSFAMFRLHR